MQSLLALVDHGVLALYQSEALALVVFGALALGIIFFVLSRPQDDHDPSGIPVSLFE